MLNGCTHKELPCRERLSELQITQDLKWNSYIQSIANDAGRNSRLIVPL